MSNSSTPSDFTPPEIQEIADLLPAYEILSFIAKGGMGAVYLARQKSLDREVAIKILPRHFGEDDEFRAAFEAEAKSMAKLNHPNLIGIYDFGQIDGMLYIIMEMVQGKSLYHSAYGKTIDPNEAARIVSGICQGLAHAHQHGILHRDIKPANILLDPNASPKIGDFGLARPVADHASDSAYGTPGYTAPEVIHHPAAVDESTDIYAVGVILYELLTSKLPESNYTPAASIVNCDPRFDLIIRKAIHTTPALRYRSATEMAEALDAITNSPQKNEPTLIHSASKPTSSTARTLLTATPSSKKPEPHTPENAKTPSTPPPSSLPSSSSNIPFIRNIIIIIALLASIYIAWEGLKIVRAKREAENEAINKANKKSEKVAKTHKKPKNNPDLHQNHPGSHQPTPPTPPVVKKETPRESLSRLRPLLINGQRSEMPIGTITRAGRARFYINQKMTWHNARRFCEKYGGHLAILPDKTHLFSLSSKLKPDQTIWLGAGSSGDGEWRWIDGSPWDHPIRQTSKSSYVAVDDTSILKPQPANTKHSFFIEWMMDGSTPATLEQQLKRCASSLSSSSPLFPAGTISYDNRHYLLVHQNTGWQSARDLAKLAGGTLSVPSNTEENEWILGFLASQLPPNQSCWLGGIRLPNKLWTWATGEPWKFAKWGEGLPDESPESACGCAATKSQTWDDYPLDSELPFFLIEWSKDGQGHQTVKTSNSNHLGKLTSIRKKCAKLIQAIQKRYEKQFTNNIKGYEQEIGVFNRSLTKEFQKLYASGIQEMQSRYVNNRIPEDIPRANMPEKLTKILDSRLKRQSETEAKLLSEIETLREKYRKNLFKMAKELKSKGLTSQLRKINEEIDNTSEGGYDFIHHIIDTL